MALTPYGQGNQQANLLRQDIPGTANAPSEFAENPFFHSPQQVEEMLQSEKIISEYARINRSIRDDSEKSWIDIRANQEKALMGMVDAFERSIMKRHEYEKAKLDAIDAEYKKLYMTRKDLDLDYEQFHFNYLKRIAALEKKQLDEQTQGYEKFFNNMTNAANGMAQKLGLPGIAGMGLAGLGVFAVKELFGFGVDQFAIYQDAARNVGMQGIYTGTPWVASKGNIKNYDVSREELATQYGVSEQETNALASTLITMGGVDPRSIYAEARSPHNALTQIAAMSSRTGIGAATLGTTYSDLLNMYGGKEGSLGGPTDVSRLFEGIAQYSNKNDLPTQMMVQETASAARGLRRFTTDIEASVVTVEKFGDMLKNQTISMQELINAQTKPGQASPGALAWFVEYLLDDPSLKAAVGKGIPGQQRFREILMGDRGETLRAAGVSEVYQEALEWGRGMAGKAGYKGADVEPMARYFGQQFFAQIMNLGVAATPQKTQEMWQRLSTGKSSEILETLPDDLESVKDSVREVYTSTKDLKTTIQDLKKEAAVPARHFRGFGAKSDTERTAELWAMPKGKKAGGGWADHGIYELGEEGPEYVIPSSIIRERWPQISKAVQGENAGASVVIENGAVVIHGEPTNQNIRQAMQMLERMIEERLTNKRSNANSLNPGW